MLHAVAEVNDHLKNETWIEHAQPITPDHGH